MGEVIAIHLLVVIRCSRYEYGDVTKALLMLQQFGTAITVLMSMVCQQRIVHNRRAGF